MKVLLSLAKLRSFMKSQNDDSRVVDLYYLKEGGQRHILTMEKIKVLILLSLFLFVKSLLFGQQLEGKYIIFTFEDSYKISQHGVQKYYWIIPEDSVQSYSNKLSSFF